MTILKFYRTGEVAADIGIVAFKNFLEEMKLNNLSIKLENNYLELDIPENINFAEEYRDFIWEKLKKIQEEKKNKKENKDEKEEKEKGIYLPYLRNSGKYGLNSGGEENARGNFKILIDIVIKLINGDIQNHQNNKSNIDNNYKKLLELEDDKCSICKNYQTPKYDISGKNREIKDREISKYIYSFLGSEENSYSNYGKENIKVCFVCEFLYLNFLIYCYSGYNNFIYTESLKELEFFNYKINLFKDMSDIGFYQKMVEYNKRNLKIYKMTSDTNKGIIINLVNVINFQKIITSIKMKFLSNNFYFDDDGSKNIIPNNKNKYQKNLKIKNIERQIELENYKRVGEIFLANLLYESKEEYKKNNEITEEEFNKVKKKINYFGKIKNIEIYLKYLKEIGGLIMEEKKIDNFFSGGKKISENLKSMDKETTAQERIAFRLIKLMQSDNRSRLLEEMMHLFVVNKVEIPFKISEIIMKEDRDNMHYAVGRFIEGLLNKENKENEENKEN